MKTFEINYVAPVLGAKSAKAVRLVDYCMGPFSSRQPSACTSDPNYLAANKNVSLLQIEDNKVTVSNGGQWDNVDQKHAVKALIEQQAVIPNNFKSWLVNGDPGPELVDSSQGLHLSGMRSRGNPEVVLVPTSNRKRFLGPLLGKQMLELKNDWVDWNDKKDAAWWSGAVTGINWYEQQKILNRMAVLEYFGKHGVDEDINLRPIKIPGKDRSLPDNIEWCDKFTKRDAFGHKCILLLPGNDIASGSSWYFAGNSVVLMPPPHMDHILYFELNAWEHYVPLENDPADIRNKLNWVLENQKEAQAIVERAHKRLQWLTGSEYLWACNEVLRRAAQSASQ